MTDPGNILYVTIDNKPFYVKIAGFFHFLHLFPKKYQKSAFLCNLQDPLGFQPVFHALSVSTT